MGIFASHNTMTYRHPRKWWMWLLVPTARCQHRDYRSQVLGGVRGFDLRIHYDKDGKIEFRHGMVSYDARDLQAIMEYANNHALSIRILLENRFYLNRIVKKRNMYQRFYSLCKSLEEQYPHITFFGGRDVYTGKTVYPFRTILREYGYYGSESGKWYFGIIPYIYAKLYNEEVLPLASNYSDGSMVMYDFV